MSPHGMSRRRATAREIAVDLFPQLAQGDDYMVNVATWRQDEATQPPSPVIAAIDASSTASCLPTPAQYLVDIQHLLAQLPPPVEVSAGEVE